MTTFDALELIEPLHRAVLDAGYTIPTPIQSQAIPPLLDGRDVLGCAQTGTGKTAAFALPVLQHLANGARPQGKRPIRALVLSPTRELATQIGDSFATYGKYLSLKHRVIFGGVGQKPQVDDLLRGVDVLVATPGRLLDLHQQGFVHLGKVEFFVLDEADRMLDMGFIHDIRKVLKLLPTERQNLLFSATMPAPIAELANVFLRDPIRVEVTPQATTVERIDQFVMYVDKNDKRKLLAHLVRDPKWNIRQVIAFTRTKHGANRVVESLLKDGVDAAAIHGNKSQGARERALERFHAGDLQVLVATDVASRGIDVDGVTHVINYDLPNISEDYVHRIGRTGRAGRDGTAIAFCEEGEDAIFLADIEKLTGVRLTPELNQPFHSHAAIPTGVVRPGARPAARPGGGGGGGRRGGGGGRRGGGGGGGGGRPGGGGGGGGGGSRRGGGGGRR